MPMRTRSCFTCRKKRIKCDGTLPHCLMCSRADKVCPGTLQGPLIVDMTAKAKSGLKRRYTTSRVQIDVAHATRMIRIGRDVSQTIVTEAFFANFLTHFTVDGEGRDIQNRLSWLHHLPHQITNRSNSALVLALQATAIAYGAIMSSQITLDYEARELYGTALRAHHDILQKSGSKRDFTIHVISTSVLLSFFEAMQATTADGYRAHIYGAARLMEVIGPGECANGVLCQLFYHIRTQMLFVQLAHRQGDVPTLAKNILQNTLRYEKAPLIQRIMSCMAGLMEIRRSKNGTKEQSIMHSSWRSQVDQLWKEYFDETNSHPRRDSIDQADHPPFLDGFTALTLAYFLSANVMLAVYDPTGAGLTGVRGDLQLILDAATYLETDRNPIAFMRMATPLLLVALHGETDQYHKSAIRVFQGWSRRSMQGISALALDTIDKREEVYNMRGCDELSDPEPAKSSELRSIKPAGNDPTPDGFE